MSVEALANSYVQTLNLENPILIRRVAYDAKVSGFNVSTIATLATLAIAIFSHSLFFLGLAWILNNARLAFMRSVEVTGLDATNVNPELLHKVANINPRQRNEEIRAYLDIHDETWEIFTYQFLDFKPWMNFAPREEQVPLSAGEQ